MEQLQFVLFFAGDHLIDEVDDNLREREEDPFLGKVLPDGQPQCDGLVEGLLVVLEVGVLVDGNGEVSDGLAEHPNSLHSISVIDYSQFISMAEFSN